MYYLLLTYSCKMEKTSNSHRWSQINYVCTYIQGMGFAGGFRTRSSHVWVFGIRQQIHNFKGGGGSIKIFKITS